MAAVGVVACMPEDRVVWSSLLCRLWWWSPCSRGSGRACDGVIVVLSIEFVHTCDQYFDVLGRGLIRGVGSMPPASFDASILEHPLSGGYVFLINGGAISWSSRKQELVTLSTAEAKYVAATHASKETIWLCKLLGKLFPSLLILTPLYCDNQAVLKLATNDNYHACTKHINLCFHFIRQTIASGVLKLLYCPTENMVMDILTKALPKWKVVALVTTLSIH